MFGGAGRGRAWGELLRKLVKLEFGFIKISKWEDICARQRKEGVVVRRWRIGGPILESSGATESGVQRSSCLVEASVVPRRMPGG